MATLIINIFFISDSPLNMRKKRFSSTILSVEEVPASLEASSGGVESAVSNGEEFASPAQAAACQGSEDPAIRD